MSNNRRGEEFLKFSIIIIALLFLLPKLSFALQLQATPNKSAVAPGEEFQIQVMLTNDGGEEKRWRYPKCEGAEHFFKTDNILVQPWTNPGCVGAQSEMVLKIDEPLKQTLRFRVPAKSEWPEHTAIYIQDGVVKFRIIVTNPETKARFNSNPLTLTVQEPVIQGPVK